MVLFAYLDPTEISVLNFDCFIKKKIKNAEETSQNRTKLQIKEGKHWTKHMGNKLIDDEQVKEKLAGNKTKEVITEV